MRNRRQVLCGLLISGLLLLQPAQPAELSADSSDRVLRDFLAGLQNLSANFAQSVTESGSGGEVFERARGTVQLSKPGKFRWDYTEPYERTIVADGDKLWFYEADLEQVTVRRISAGLGDTPAALLTGDVSALEQYELLDTWQASGLSWLRLEPRSAEADFAEIELGFADQEIRMIEFLDRLGQRTRITLTDIRRPQEIDGQVFEFVIPDGVDVIGADEL